MFYTTGDGFEDDRLEPLRNEKLARSSSRYYGNGLATVNKSLAVERLNIQKRSRPVSPDVTKKPRHHVQQIETAVAGGGGGDDDSNDLRSKPSAAKASLVTASSRFQEERTLVHLPLQQINPKSSLTTRRYFIVQELFESEKKYCSCLQLLQNHFASRLSMSADVDQSDLRVIFPPCLRQILAFHGEFVRRLGLRLAKWTELSTAVDLVLLLFQSADCDLLKHYHTYFSLFRDSLNHIRRLRRLNPDIETLIIELESDERCRGLAIGAYLLTPIQRIPRYVLLLEQLAKCTAESHPDHQATGYCLTMLGEFLRRLDSTIVESSAMLSNADTFPKRKRRFLSFRQNSSGDVGADSHATYVMRPKDSSSLKSNRISLDFSFKKRKEPEFMDKKVLSEICLNESGGSVEYCYLPPTLRNSAAYQSPNAQERTLQLSNPPKQAKRRIDQSDVHPTLEAYGHSDRKPTKISDGAKVPYFSHGDMPPPGTSCESDVHDSFGQEKKSRLGSLTRKLRLPSKKKRKFRRQRSSVGDAIRNFFIRKGFSRAAYSRHSSTFDGNKDSYC